MRQYADIVDWKKYTIHKKNGNLKQKMVCIKLNCNEIPVQIWNKYGNILTEKFALQDLG